MSNVHGLSEAQLRQRREAGYTPTHGAKSPATVTARAKTIERRFLREMKLKRSDLDGLALRYLDLVCRGQAKLDLRDEHDPLDEARDYWLAHNAVRRDLEKLEARLRVLNLDNARPAPGQLDRLLAERNADGRERS